MTRLYTTLFYSGAGATGTLAYTVPDGYRAVVTDLFFADNAADGTYAQIVDSELSSIAGGTTNIPGPDQTYVRWHGHQALNAGDTISLATDSTEPSWRITGWLLSLT